MNTKDIIALNNDVRQQLNDKNLKIYEDMLLYIRSKSNKSEQQTEEVLLELLNHLIEAQNEGKTAEDVFGQDFKSYCEEVITEIPSEKNKKRLLFISYIVIQFLAIISFVHGFLGYGLHYFFELGSDMTTISLGTGIVIILIELLLLYIVVKVVFHWITKTTFTDKKPSKFLEFFQAWLFLTFMLALFILLPRFIPDFGTQINVPILVFGVVGILLYLVSIILNKKYRIIK